MRVLIVDDEALAREGIRARLEQVGGVEIIGECADGDRAAEQIRQLKPDVVFLDIQMPGKNGLEVVGALPPELRPYFVFVTAYDRHAIRAFELHALDYLLKPISNDRFAVALERVRAQLAAQRSQDFQRRVGALLSAGEMSAPRPAERTPERLPIRVANRIVLVAVADIDWIEASGDYASLHVGKKSWLLREPLSSLESRLRAGGFIRVHRSAIVNTSRVVELKALEDGDYSILLRDGVSIKLSRHYRSALQVLLGSN